MSTKSPRSDKQYVWEGEADSSSYTIKEETDPQLIIPRGTRITLHLKVRYAFVFLLYLNASICSVILNFFSSSRCLMQRDDKGFADPERIQKLVKNYSQFVSFPIYTWQEKGYTKEV